MRNPKALALVAVFAIDCAVTSLAWADEDRRQAAIVRLPAPAPGPAFPELPEVDMVALCERLGRHQRYYPPRALSRGRRGDVVLDCVPGDDTRMSTCQVLYEDPPDFGFGDAALRIACHFRIDPATIEDGGPVAELPPDARFYRRNAEGEPWHVRLPVRFRIG
jgi:hypothetical protein